MRTRNVPSRFRYTLTFSAVFLVLSAVCPAQQADAFRLSSSALKATRTIGVDPPLGPQPPCRNDPIPPYPDLDNSAAVKSWSNSASRRDWKPPACTGWSQVGFTTLVTVVARFHHTSQAESLLVHIGAISGLAGM